MPRPVYRDPFDPYNPTYRHDETENPIESGTILALKDKDTRKRGMKGNGVVVWWIKDCLDRGRADEHLWEDFRFVFDGWTEATFGVLAKRAKEDLRELLLQRGVYVKTSSGNTIEQQLAGILTETEQHVYTEQEIDDQKKKIPVFYSKLDPEFPDDSSDDDDSEKGKKIPSTSGSVPVKKLSSYAQMEKRTYKDQLDASNNYGLTNLLKSYDNEQKYGGEDDVLDQKVLYFYDFCKKCAVPSDKLLDAFSTMLKGKALNYYYSSCAGRGLSLQPMLSRIKAHFETDQRKQDLLDKWQKLELCHITNNPDNAGKTVLQCYELLIERLQKLNTVLLGRVTDLESRLTSTTSEIQQLKDAQQKKPVVMKNAGTSVSDLGTLKRAASDADKMDAVSKKQRGLTVTPAATTLHQRLNTLFPVFNLFKVFDMQSMEQDVVAGIIFLVCTTYKNESMQNLQKFIDSGKSSVTGWCLEHICWNAEREALSDQRCPKHSGFHQACPRVYGSVGGCLDLKMVPYSDP